MYNREINILKLLWVKEISYQSLLGGGGQFIPQVDGARPATIVTNELVTGSATHDQPQDANVPPPRLLQLDGAKGQPQSSDDDSEDEFVEDTTGPQAKVAKMTSASSNKSQSVSVRSVGLQLALQLRNRT